MSRPDPVEWTGRCYCGKYHVHATRDPFTVVHCHCADCRRVTGAAFGTFAAFGEDDLSVVPPLGEVSHAKGVQRRFCPSCGSALTARFDYLAAQVYVPIGILEGADRLQPERHCHAENMLTWLRIDDELPRDAGSGRAALASSTP